METELNFTIDEMFKQLELHEARKKKPYVCTANKITIGVGRNLTDRGISNAIIDMMLFEDFNLALSDAIKLFPNFSKYSGARQMALVDMSFNLGYNRLSKFMNMRKAIDNGDWVRAADEALNSKWAEQVGQRAKTLADMMKKG